MKIYMASSWRNRRLDLVARELRAIGHEVYDFREANPVSNFNWAMLDAAWDWENPVLSAVNQQRALRHPIAVNAFGNDDAGLDWADCGVLVLPCGKSAHLEAGMLLGRGKPVHVLLADEERPELMYLLATGVYANLEELLIGLGCGHKDDESDCTCPCKFDPTHACKDCTCVFEVTPEAREALLGAM